MKIYIVLLAFCSLAFAEPAVEIDFKVSGGINFKATTKNVKGKVILQNGEYIAQGIAVDLKTLSTKMDLRDDHMKNKYLEVSKYPEATLVFGKGKGGKGIGKIKIRGIEKEIKGTYRPISDQEVEARFDINLSDFNIKGIRYMGVGVKDILNVKAIVPLEKGPATTAASMKK